MAELGLFNHALTGTPIGTALDLCMVLCVILWLLSVITRNYSWVDRVWSILPLLYCLLTIFALDSFSPRVLLMTILVGLWSVRLTFNLARKGGYRRGGEDYRWAVIRKRVGPIWFQVLNIALIVPGQMLVVWLFTSPVHQAWQAVDVPLGVMDIVLTVLFLILLTGETVADEQMWRFQKEKKRRLATGEKVVSPFITSGLFRYSRHPSYFCDIGMWYTFYLLGVSASGEWLHWTALGCLAITVTFAGSIPLTESISASKYSEYRSYQESTPVLVPLLHFKKFTAAR